MSNPDYIYDACFQLPNMPRQNAQLYLNAKRRSAGGVLTVSGFEVRVDGQTIFGWKTRAQLRKEKPKRCQNTQQSNP